MEEHVHSLVFVSAHKAGLESDVQRVHIIIIVAFTNMHKYYHKHYHIFMANIDKVICYFKTY